MATWTTGLAYGLATLYYQAATFARDPVQALGWIAGVLATFAAALLWLRRLPPGSFCASRCGKCNPGTTQI